MYRTGTTLDDIIGEVVKEVYYSDEGLIKIVTNNNLYSLAVYGDCCSHSEWQAVFNVQNIIGKVITKIDMTEDIDPPVGDHYDYLQVYNFTLESGGAIASFHFFNDSNGYYGGWMGCNKGNIPEEIYGEKITNNWSF